MKISDILNSEKMSLSFEVFPPKKETSFDNVRAATEQIAAFRPSFMSVTYGAGGGTSRFTIDIAKYHAALRCSDTRTPDLRFLKQTNCQKSD